MRKVLPISVSAALIGLALLAVPGGASAADEPKAKGVELAVFLGDKPVGSEVFRQAKGTEANFFSSEAELQDKVGKAGWRSFKQRAALQTSPSGDVQQYDRWIVVVGATQQSKLFNFGGQWRISVADAAVDGKKPKPKVTDVKVAAPFIVLDERLPSLVVAAAERMAGKSECDYVRVDDATAGKAKVVAEQLVDAKGGKFSRLSLKSAKLDAWVLRDHAGNLLAIKGVGAWRAVVKGAKVPALDGLKVVETAAAQPADAAADVTPATGK